MPEDLRGKACRSAGKSSHEPHAHVAPDHVERGTGTAPRNEAFGDDRPRASSIFKFPFTLSADFPAPRSTSSHSACVPIPSLRAPAGARTQCAPLPCSTAPARSLDMFSPDLHARMKRGPAVRACAIASPLHGLRICGISAVGLVPGRRLKPFAPRSTLARFAPLRIRPSLWRAARRGRASQPTCRPSNLEARVF